MRCPKELLFPVEAEVHPFVFAGRSIVYLAMIVWGWAFISKPMESNYVGGSFLHAVNLPFHEAGHILFPPLGDFMTSLGGSLGQLLVPLLCAGAFLKRRNAFGASVALWWLGENFLDIAPYIGDARALQLVLLGGRTGAEVEGHDWEAILTALGWLKHDHTLARASHGLGVLLMLTALAWGGYLLYAQSKRIYRQYGGVRSA